MLNNIKKVKDYKECSQEELKNIFGGNELESPGPRIHYGCSNGVTGTTVGPWNPSTICGPNARIIYQVISADR